MKFETYAQKIVIDYQPNKRHKRARAHFIARYKLHIEQIHSFATRIFVHIRNIAAVTDPTDVSHCDSRYGVHIFNFHCFTA